MKISFGCIAFILSILSINAQIPIEDYTKEINNLKTENDFVAYWKKIDSIDQLVLLKAKDEKIRDSISIDNMIKTALVYKIHGESIFKPNISAHIFNLSHNYFGDSSLVFWPIIKVSKIYEQDNLKHFYPSYVLECISLPIYGYSFLRQDDKYERALKKLDALPDEDIVSALLKAFEKQKRIKRLKPLKVIGTWKYKPSNLWEESENNVFQFVKLEDNKLYFEKFSQRHRLVQMKTIENKKILRVENEPFDWKFVLYDNGNLELVDENNEILIAYDRSK